MRGWKTLLRRETMRITREKKRAASKKRGGVVRNTAKQNTVDPTSINREQASNLQRPSQTEAMAKDCERKRAAGTIVHATSKIAPPEMRMFRQQERRQLRSVSFRTHQHSKT